MQDRQSSSEIMHRWCQRMSESQKQNVTSYDFEFDAINIFIFEWRFRLSIQSTGDLRFESSRKPIAKISYDKSTRLWLIHRLRGDGLWHLYELGECASHLQEALDTIESDHLGHFW